MLERPQRRPAGAGEDEDEDEDEDERAWAGKRRPIIGSEE
jgi:hypothetical protein